MFSVIFPGQGSQSVGMAKELYNKFETFKINFEEADDLLNYQLSKIILEGPDDKLNLTENTQPAIFLISYSIFQVIKNEFKINLNEAKYFEEKRKSGVQQEAIKFVESIWDADCPYIAIENPVGILSTQSKLGKTTQYIQPYWFGEKQRKKTGLWLKGFPKLVPTDMVDISKVS